MYLNAEAGHRRRAGAARSIELAREQEGEGRPHQGRRGRRLRRRHGGDGPAPPGGHRGHRASSPIRSMRTSGGRQVMAHAPQALRRRQGRQGRGAARQRGHEHHAADRRAARAPRHLHGGAAAHPEGLDINLPAETQERASSSRPMPARSCSSTRPTSKISVNKQDVTIGRPRDAAADHLRGAQGQDDVHRRRRLAALRRHRRASSTRPRAPASRRSASSPKA